MDASGAIPGYGIRKGPYEGAPGVADDATEEPHPAARGSGVEVDHLSGVRQGMLGTAPAGLAERGDVFGGAVYGMRAPERKGGQAR